MTVIPLSALPARYAGQGRLRYIIDGVLPVGVTVVYGPSGVGKTGLAVATAMAIARGVPWAGRKVAPGPVMYLAAENFLGVLDRFYAAAIEANSTHDVPVTIADRLDEALAEKGGRAALGRAIADAGGGDPRLIVVDTLATAFGQGSQDESGAASVFMNELEALASLYQCAVVVVHHTAKRGGEMRGSQIFYDRADAVIRLEKRRDGAILTVEKQRNGRAEGSTFCFGIDETSIIDGGEEISVQIVTDLHEDFSDAKQATPEPTRETDRQLVWRVLGELSRELSVVAVPMWRERCFRAWDGKTKEQSGTAFSKAIKWLKDNKKIAVRKDTVSIVISGNPVGNHAPSVSATVTTAPLKGAGVGNVGKGQWEEEVLEGVLEGVDERIVRKRRVG